MIIVYTVILKLNLNPLAFLLIFKTMDWSWDLPPREMKSTDEAPLTFITGAVPSSHQTQSYRLLCPLE